MKVLIPRNNINERIYIVDLLLSEFLGLEYSIEFKSVEDYTIILENGNKLIIEDHFFNDFINDLEYLNEKNIPTKIKFTKNNFIIENNIPIIFGNEKLEIKEDKIICGIDIFAASFFMITRWEEYVNKIRDNHGRFPASASLAFKNNFLDRPVVNEYVEMLWNMLKFLGCKQKRKKRNFNFLITHDIDYASYKIFRADLKKFLSYLLKKDFLNLKKIFKEKTKTLLYSSYDPWDTFDYLMDISESIGTKSYFFLHSSKYARQDINNDKFLKKISKKITQRGHFIGYHPSYNSYNNLEIFLKDKERIEKIIGQKLTFGRQHYLRFEMPTTWQIWEDAKMEWDSTLGYADIEGFRCGVCYPFSTFNIKARKKLKLIERPLIIMEGSLIYNQNLDIQEIGDRIKKLIQIVRKYNGEFVILWHNSSFNCSLEKYNTIYEKVLKEKI